MDSDSLVPCCLVLCACALREDGTASAQSPLPWAEAVLLECHQPMSILQDRGIVCTQRGQPSAACCQVHARGTYSSYAAVQETDSTT